MNRPVRWSAVPMFVLCCLVDGAGHETGVATPGSVQVRHRLEVQTTELTPQVRHDGLLKMTVAIRLYGLKPVDFGPPPQY